MKSEEKDMKSKYFRIKTLSGHELLAKANEEITREEFLEIYVDFVKDAFPMSKDEFKSITGEE